MELILGGVYQGKLDYARNSYALTDEDIFICTEQAPLLFEKNVLPIWKPMCAAVYTVARMPLPFFSQTVLHGRTACCCVQIFSVALYPWEKRRGPGGK